MLKVSHIVDIKALHQQGLSIRAIAETTGLARNTIRKVIRGQHPLKRQATPRSSKVEPFKDFLRGRIAEHPLSAVRLIDEIRPLGYTGSLVTLRRFLAEVRTAEQAHGKVTLRFETPPGHQAQVDWGDCGQLLLPCGLRCQVHVFTYVLGYSRMLFIRFTTSMRLPQLIACHQEAFAALAGWPHEILYDNMKQIRIGPGRLNDQFLDFAQHHGFSVKTCRPYRARTKGKVERMVDYVKDNFLLGRTFADLNDLNAQGQSWLAQTANVRIHGTTGRRPVDLFEQERGLLVPFASVPAYRYLELVPRKVNWEAMVHYHGSRYSVPPCYAGKKVHIAAWGGQVLVRAGDTIIAEHRQASGRGQSIVDNSHLEELWKITREQVKPAQEVRWQQAQPEVARTDLSVFEEVLS